MDSRETEDSPLPTAAPQQCEAEAFLELEKGTRRDGARGRLLCRCRGLDASRRRRRVREAGSWRRGCVGSPQIRSGIGRWGAGEPAGGHRSRSGMWVGAGAGRGVEGIAPVGGGVDRASSEWRGLRRSEVQGPRRWGWRVSRWSGVGGGAIL
jgi:hypothetical protein